MNPIIKNLKNKYQNEIDTAKTNIEVFLEKNVGVAEHIDFTTTINNELEKIAHAKDMIEAIEELNS